MARWRAAVSMESSLIFHDNLVARMEVDRLRKVLTFA